MKNIVCLNEKRTKMSETSKPKLLPCPFCECRTPQVYDKHNRRKRLVWYAQCTNFECKAELGPFDTKEEARSAWNRRGSREEPKWTKEPPTEEGWYFLTDSHCAHRDESPMCNEIVHVGKRLYIRLMRAGGESWELLDKFCAAFKRSKRKLYWQKIDIPALSEKKN